MPDDRYLWDRSGPPDPEIDRLEALLSGFQPSPARTAPWVTRPRPWRSLAAVAAMALLALALSRPTPPVRPAWQVTRVQGSSIAQEARVGQWLHTDAHSRLELRRDEVGVVEVAENTRVRVTRGRQLSLQRGTLRARIWAPPGEFAVDTPAAMAVDLGCIYTLTVNGDNSTVVRVSMGWVALDGGGHEAFIPAGAACTTRPGRPPGLPFREDAPAPWRASLARLDSGTDPAALAIVLADAQPGDAFTLWHLLRRVPVSHRPAVLDRLVALVPAAADVPRPHALQATPSALDALWNTLDLGDAAFWRTWKQSLRP